MIYNNLLNETLDKGTLYMDSSGITGFLDIFNFKILKLPLII